MTEEPRWPTVRDVEGETSTPERFKAVTRAIELCRAAWLTSLDDPAKSPVGEVRASPSGIAYQRTVDVNGEPMWRSVIGRPVQIDVVMKDDISAVKGWPVIGAVPGTPAAEAKP